MQESDMLLKAKSAKSLEQVCDDLEAAVAAHHFGVMTTHDLKATMAKKGVDFAKECRIFEVCNPNQAKNVLETNMAIATALPCRIAVYEEGGERVLATIRPTAMLGMFEAEGAAPVAREVEETITAIMEEAAGS